MKRWYVVYTHPGNETIAQGQLEQQGFVTYLPRCLKQMRQGNRITEIAVPLFPRYIFVELDIDAQRWRAINSTFGVRYLVCMGDRPAALPETVMPEILDRETEKGYIVLPREEPFSKGEVVQITAGPLIEQVGLFQCTSDDERTTVLLNLLGREVPIRVRSEALRAYA